jgi:hypothetical protein
MACSVASLELSSRVLAEFLAGAITLPPITLKRVIQESLEEILCSPDPETRGRAAAHFREIGFDLNYHNRILAATYGPSSAKNNKKEIENLTKLIEVPDSCRLEVDDTGLRATNRVSCSSLKPLGITG